MIPCFHWESTSSHEYKWNSTSCPEGVPRKKNGISTARAAAPIASSGAQSSAASDVPVRSFNESFAVRVLSRVVPLSAITNARTESKVYFNGDLTFLKPSCNGLRKPYSQWGRTDHEELKGRAKDGVRPFDSSETIVLLFGIVLRIRASAPR
jgi:hypothetical protein